MTEHDINQLVARHSGGNFCGFKDLYGQYAQMIRSVLFKLCDGPDLDDMVQEVFIKIVRALPDFKGQCQLKTWIYRIAYNHALDERRRFKPLMSNLDPTELANRQSDAQCSHAADLVKKGLSQLSEEHRTVIVLHCLEGLPVNEVADVLSVPQGTIKSRLFHAKARMYEIIKKEGGSI